MLQVILLLWTFQAALDPYALRQQVERGETPRILLLCVMMLFRFLQMFRRNCILHCIKKLLVLPV